MAIHRTGRRPWEKEHNNVESATGMREQPRYQNLDTNNLLYHCFLDIDFLSSGKTEVSDFGHVVFTYKDIPGCQVSMDELNGEKENKKEMKTTENKMYG